MQTVNYNKWMKFNFKPLKSMINIYNSASDENFAKNLFQYKINSIYTNLINLYAEKGFKIDCPTVDYFVNDDKYTVEENNKLLLLFSGGKDSTAAAIKYKNLGYDVVLYFLQGVNISYADELIHAQKIAELLNLPLKVETVKIEGKGAFLENPTKNQLLMAFAINYGLTQNISKYAYGGFEEDDIKTSAFDRNFSDSKETFEEFEKSVKKVFSQFEIHCPFRNEISTLKLIGDYPELWNEFQSCLMPLRFRDFRKKQNEEKYNIKLLNNRCGSCWKCCMEYIVWCDLDLVEYNEGFYEHCLELLRDKIPEERPYAKPTKDLKEVYMIYVDSEELLSKSKYFANRKVKSTTEKAKTDDLDKSIKKEDFSYKIELATEDDFQPLLDLWKTERNVLGPYYKQDVKDEILNNEMLVAKDNNGKLIGFCGMIFKKRKFVLEIDGICVVKNYRKFGIGRAFIEKLKTYGRPIELEAVDGAENNKFYDRVATVIGTRMSKSGTMKLRQYRIENGYKEPVKVSLLGK